MSNKIIEVENLQTAFMSDKGELISVDEVTFNLEPGETIGIVGESGCGKSVTSLSIMRLLGKNGYIKNGSVKMNGKELNKLTEAEMRQVRGNQISMIFQEPMTSLNPVYTIGNQMIEGIKLHLKMSTKDAKAYAIDMLKQVKIPRAEEVM